MHILPNSPRDWTICIVTLAVIAGYTIWQEKEARRKEKEDAS